MTRYRAKDGRELFVSDGESNGKEWAIYYTTLSGEVKRASVLQPEPCQHKRLAEILLNAYAKQYQFEVIEN